jgi:hypothetical protein
LFTGGGGIGDDTAGDTTLGAGLDHAVVVVLTVVGGATGLLPFQDVVLVSHIAWRSLFFLLGGAEFFVTGVASLAAESGDPRPAGCTASFLSSLLPAALGEKGAGAFVSTVVDIAILFFA